MPCKQGIRGSIEAEKLKRRLAIPWSGVDWDAKRTRQKDRIITPASEGPVIASFVKEGDSYTIFCGDCGREMFVCTSALGGNSDCPRCGALNLIPFADELNRQLEIRREEAKRLMDPRLNAIRQRVIAEGRATAETVDSVIYDMGVDEFFYFRGEFFEVSRLDFKP